MKEYDKTCLSCGGGFVSSRSHAKTCSPTCRSRLNYKLKDQIIKNCKMCNNEFTCTGKNFSKIYCMAPCRKKSRYIRESSSIDEKLKKNLRSRLYDYVVEKNKCNISAVRHLGCSIEALKQHIESQFTEGMSWDNYGEWHIDHIKPLSKFDLSNKEQFKAACHYTNLQPLWAKDNLSKGAKIEEQYNNIENIDNDKENI